MGCVRVHSQDPGWQACHPGMGGCDSYWVPCWTELVAGTMSKGAVAASTESLGSSWACNWHPQSTNLPVSIGLLKVTVLWAPLGFHSLLPGSQCLQKGIFCCLWGIRAGNPLFCWYHSLVFLVSAMVVEFPKSSHNYFTSALYFLCVKLGSHLGLLAFRLPSSISCQSGLTATNSQSLFILKSLYFTFLWET